MTDRSVTHATFVVERTFDVPPARVFNAFADPEVKARWFASPDDWQDAEVSMDFRVGGREINNGGPVGGARGRASARACGRGAAHDVGGCAAGAHRGR